MIIFYIMLIVILTVCAVLVLYITAQHTFLFTYLYIDRSLHTLRDPERYPPISPWVYFNNYWLELFYQFGKFYLFPLKFLKLSCNVRKHKTAVLLIHGYSRNKTDWLWLRKQIGTLPIFTVNLSPSFASIEQITQNSIPQAIATIQNKIGCEKIILIGHSMGGLVASYYSEYLDTNNIISHIITIASPLHGTKISIMGYGQNAKQMCPGNSFLNHLRHKIHNSSKTYYQIATQFENLLFPWDSALLPDTTAECKFIRNFVPHLSLLHDKETAQKLKHWLTDIEKRFE